MLAVQNQFLRQFFFKDIQSVVCYIETKISHTPNLAATKCNTAMCECCRPSKIHTLKSIRMVLVVGSLGGGEVMRVGPSLIWLAAHKRASQSALSLFPPCKDIVSSAVCNLEPDHAGHPDGDSQPLELGKINFCYS